MQPDFYTTDTTQIIDENGSLSQFYSLTEKIRKSRFVRYTGKTDDIDNIQWKFKYHGHPLTLQYNIYNGVSIYAQQAKDQKAMHKLLEKIIPKTA
jgi:hypothetical protein